MEHALIKIDVPVDGKRLELWRQGGIHLVKDLDLGEWLGFERPRHIRELIERHRPSLGEVSPYRTAKPPSPTGGRPAQGWLLTEEQALFIAAKSDTPKATAVLKTIVKVFLAVVRGQLPTPRTLPPAALPTLASGKRLIDVTMGELLQEVERVAEQAAVRAVEQAAARAVEQTIARTQALRDPQHLKSREAARLVGRSYGAFKQFLLRNTDFPRGKAGKRLIFDEARIRAWMEANPKRKRTTGTE